MKRDRFGFTSAEMAAYHKGGPGAVARLRTEAAAQVHAPKPKLVVIVPRPIRPRIRALSDGEFSARIGALPPAEFAAASAELTRLVGNGEPKSRGWLRRLRDRAWTIRSMRERQATLASLARVRRAA